MSEQYDSKEDVFCIRLKLGDECLSVTCKREDEVAFRKAASIFNDVYSKYGQEGNLEAIDLLRITGFHFALQSVINDVGD
jgi:hypothetical protein